MKNIHKINQHTYITSDSEIKEGDWVYSIWDKKIKRAIKDIKDALFLKKIILTTDQDLIFACQEHPKNCKGIHLSEETLKERALKEEPKQETLEEVAERFANECNSYDAKLIADGVEFGAKWQQEQDKNKYSEEEVNNLLYRFLEHVGEKQKRTILNVVPNEWFEEFKKK